MRCFSGGRGSAEGALASASAGGEAGLDTAQKPPLHPSSSSAASSCGTSASTAMLTSLCCASQQQNEASFFARWTSGRNRSGSTASLPLPSDRRRADSDYATTVRYDSLRKQSSSLRLRSRSASTSSAYRDASFPKYRARMGRRTSSVHAVDVSVLQSLSLPDNAATCGEPSENESPAMGEVHHEEDVCLICMGKFTRKKPSIPIPCSAQCNLAPVHAKCIYEWKEQKRGSGSCPLCRSNLEEINYKPPDLLQLSSLIMFGRRKHFVHAPVPKGAGMLRCYIKARHGMFGSPIRYEMYVQAPTTLRYPLGVLPTAESPEAGDQLLMTASKRLTKWGSSVIDISMDAKGKEFKQNGPNYLGSVHGTLSGTEFTLMAPYRSSSEGSGGASVARELVAVTYTQNRIGSTSGPRRMNVALPTVSEACDESKELDQVSLVPSAQSSVVDSSSVRLQQQQQQQNERSANEEDAEDDDEEDGDVSKPHVTDIFRPNGKNDHMISFLRKGEETVARHLRLQFGQNKEPYWLESIQAFSLDFQGRVTLPSNKNFQLELDGSRENVSMQFGKVVAAEENRGCAVYTVDFSWPLSPMQAFGIALSSTDRKMFVA